MTLFIKFIILCETMIEEGCQLNRSTSSRSGWISLIACSARRSHFVHPCQTIIGIPADYKSCIFIDIQMNCESITRHICIYLISCIPLSVGDAISVRLENTMNNFLNKHNFGFSSFYFLSVLKRITA